MGSFEHVEFVHVGGLDTEGEAVDSSGADLMEEVERGCARVGFDGGFEVGRFAEREGGAQRVHDGGQLRSRKKRGSAAAEEEGGDVGLDRPFAIALGYSTNEFNFANQRVDVGGNQRLLTRVGVEVTVGATVDAERDVEVEGGVRCQLSGSKFQVSGFKFQGFEGGCQEKKDWNRTIFMILSRKFFHRRLRWLNVLLF